VATGGANFRISIRLPGGDIGSGMPLLPSPSGEMSAFRQPPGIAPCSPCSARATPLALNETERTGAPDYTASDDSQPNRSTEPLVQETSLLARFISNSGLVVLKQPFKHRQALYHHHALMALDSRT
jgi:hypothetical protein